MGVWDVANAAQLNVLEDPWQAATGQPKRADLSHKVQALVWVLSAPALLAVALASGLLVIWDTRGKHCDSN